MKLSTTSSTLLAQLGTVSRVASTRSAVQALSGVQLLAQDGLWKIDSSTVRSSQAKQSS